VKKFLPLLILIVFNIVTPGQVGFVEVGNPVYDFLNRMQTYGIIKDYNNFELPKTRKEIGKWLRQVNNNYKHLSRANKELLKQYLSEFEFEAKGTLNKTISSVSRFPFNLFNSDEKYIYYFKKGGSSFFLNFLSSLKTAYRRQTKNNLNQNVSLFNFGGKLRGTFFNKLGFEIKATNGTYWGNKIFAETFPETKDNYKFKYTESSNPGSKYFDNTSGFIAYESNWLRFKVGRDRNLIGEGSVKEILSDNSPLQDYFSLGLNYKAFKLTFFYSKLLGINKYFTTPTGDQLRDNITDKFFVYHRFSLNLHPFIFGVGEVVIYANRGLDFSYLNPFSFFKSAEHANIDRDNTLLFFDFTSYYLKNFKFYSSIMIDDLDFSKFGTHWLGNQILLNFGIYTTLFEKYLPLDFEIQYLHIDPYFYSNRYFQNNYTNLNENLGAPFQPNSSNFIIRLFYTPTGNLILRAEFINSIHGENIYSDDGKLLVNNGGSIFFGYRKIDLPDAPFLAGPKDYLNKFSLKAEWEFFNNYYLNFFFQHNNFSSPGGNSSFTMFGMEFNMKI